MQTRADCRHFRVKKRSKWYKRGIRMTDGLCIFGHTKNINTMGDYQKVSSIRFTSEVTPDSSTPITKFNKSALVNWLTANVTSNDVAVFFRRESNSGNDVQLVISAVDANGVPTSEQHASAKLPCPNFCPTG